MEFMRAIDIKGGKGPATSLYMSNEIEKPIAGPGEAIVKLKYFGINRMDLTQRAGLYQVPPQAGKILGVEFSGIIESLGDKINESENESSFNVGDAVFGLTYGGAYAEYVKVSIQMLIRKPDSIPWEKAAGIPETWITALQAMTTVGEFTSGKSILWHAGASSVSIAGIQLSKVLGASAIYATVGSDEKVEFCKSMGATAAWNYRTSNWEDEVRIATQGKGVDIIIDFVGQKYFQMNLNSTALDGRIVIVGLLSGAKMTGAELDLSPFVTMRLRIEGSRLRSRGLSYQQQLRDKLERDVVPKFVDGSLSVPIEKVFDWQNIQDAHLLMESNTIKGKIVCRVS